MKLYVGAWSGGDGGVFVATGNGAHRYQLACDGGMGEPGRVALAILADHLKDPGRALVLREGFERAVGPRLRDNFWTLRESEVAKALALLE